MLRIHVLGGLRLERDGASIDVPETARGRSLLAWLAVHPGSHGRRELAGRLRPDVLEESARASLRQAVWSVRQALGPDADALLVGTRETVGLAAEPLVWVDVAELRRLRAGGRLEEALALCSGELLAGLDDDWVYEARDEHRAERAGILADLAAAAEARGDHAGAVRYTRQLAGEDPLAEQPHRELMRRLAAAGDRAAALAAYDSLRDRLRRELAIVPSPDTRALADELRVASEAPAAAKPPQRPPLPDPLARADVFVGRAAELRSLESALSDARAATTRIVCVTGEPGIGKTSLAAALARRAHAAGAAVLYGRSDEESLIPFQPFVEALSAHVGAQPPAWRAALLRRHPQLAALLPTLAQAAAGDGLGERYRLFEGVRALLEDAAAARPLLLVLDDVHWADPPALLLLRHLGRRLRETRLLIVCTYRDTELGRDHPLQDALTGLRRDHPVQQIGLEGLGAGDVAELVRRRTAGRADARMADELLERTGGNPFFVGELLRELDELSTGAPRLPAAIAGLVERRVQRLGSDATTMLTVAALIGPEFALADLDAAVGAATPALLDALDRATAAGLIIEIGGGERYAFAHRLVQQALHESLSAARRRQAHLEIGSALERRSRGVEGQIAHHLLAALPAGDVQHAVRWAIAAGRQAAARLAHEDATSHFAHGLAALRRHGDDPALECELLLALGDAHERSGEPDAAREAFADAARVARALGDVDALARAALGAGRLALVISVADDRLVELLGEALQRLGDRNAPLRSRLLGRLAVELCYSDAVAADRLSADAVAAGESGRDPAALASALIARHAAIWSPERADERLVLATRAVELAERAGDPEAELHARNWRVLDMLELGNVDAVHTEVAAFAAVADAVGLPHHRWYVPLWQAALAALAGRFDEAQRLRGECHALGRRAQDPNVDNFVHIQTAVALFEQRRFADVDLDRIVNVPDWPVQRAGWDGFVAVVLWETGERERSRELLRELAQDRFVALPWGANWHVIADVAEACALLEDVPSASLIYERLRPYAHLFPVVARAVACLGSAEYFLGRLAAAAGRTEVALAHFDRALDANREAGARPRAALAAWRLAELLCRSGRSRDRERAAVLLVAAHDNAAALGLTAFAAEVQAAADELHVSV